MLDIHIDPRFNLTDEQIFKILDKLVPLIAKPADHEFFRQTLYFKAKESTSSAFAAFVAKLLKGLS